MQKTKIITSETNPTDFRLIININEIYSIGVILTESELKQLFFSIKDLIESMDTD